MNDFLKFSLFENKGHPKSGEIPHFPTFSRRDVSFCNEKSDSDIESVGPASRIWTTCTLVTRSMAIYFIGEKRELKEDSRCEGATSSSKRPFSLVDFFSIASTVSRRRQATSWIRKWRRLIRHLVLKRVTLKLKRGV